MNRKDSTLIPQIELWTLLLRGLQCLILDKRAEIRDRASALLWEILHKTPFTEAFWDTVYEIILGYIPKSFLHFLSEDPKSADYVKATLFSVIDTFAEKFQMLEKRCADFIDKMNAFISEGDEAAAKTGIEVHKAFMQKVAGEKMQKEGYWDSIVKGLQKVLANTLPKKLLEPAAISVATNGDLKLAFPEQEILSKSLIHLNVVNYIKTVIVKECLPHMPVKIAFVLLEALHESATFAKEFNQNVELRMRLRKAGFRSQSQQLPTLIHQEREALSGYFGLAYEIYVKNSREADGQTVLENMWKYDFLQVPNPAYRIMKGVLEDHIKVQGKTEGTEDAKEAELKKLVIGKNAIVSEAILPILQKITPSEVNLFILERL